MLSEKKVSQYNSNRTKNMTGTTEKMTEYDISKKNMRTAPASLTKKTNERRNRRAASMDNRGERVAR